MLNNRLFQAVSAAAVGAALVMAMPGFSPPVEASTAAPAVAAEPTVPAPQTDACSQRAWPYYGAECLHSQAPARVVRIVSTDRLPK